MNRINTRGTLNGTAPDEASRGGSADGRSGRGGIASAFLRVRLFYKILVANVVLMIAVAAAVAWVVSALGGLAGEQAWGTIVVIIVLGLAATIIVNAMILRLALQPLEQLQQTAERVGRGDVEARAPVSPVADPQMERLVRTFNRVLDGAAEYRRRLREIALRALGAAEEERKRIAAELHDGTAQTIAALRVQLRVARKSGDAATRDALLDALSEQLGELVDEIREMAGGLRPSALDMLGLAPALEAYVRHITERTGLEIDAKLEPVAGLLTPEAELALYRVLQEAISNVVRHADADRVTLRLVRRDGRVEAIVRDDGRGFALEDANARRALGLWGMQERASYVGGSVEVVSRAGEGTRVEVRIPIAEEAASHV